MVKRRHEAVEEGLLDANDFTQVPGVPERLPEEFGQPVSTR